MLKRKNGVAGKDMQKEEQTICRLKNNGKEECRGGLMLAPVSRLEESLGHRVYQCDKCKSRYKFQ